MVDAVVVKDPLDSFTDREQVLAVFEQLLAQAQPGQLRMLAIKGNSGTGKTLLTRYLVERVSPGKGWRSGLISLNQLSAPDFRSLLSALEDALRPVVARESLLQYRKRRDQFQHSFDEYRASITIHQQAEATNQASLSNTTQTVQVDAQLRQREMQLRSELTRALLELAEETSRPLCLLLDGYERLPEAGPELTGWLLGEVLPSLVRASSHPMLVVTLGWEWPAEASLQPATHQEELRDFNQAHLAEFLEKQGLLELGHPTEALIMAFYTVTMGHPLVLALAAEYFKTLPTAERTAERLRTDQPLIDEWTRVAFIEERLLMRLEEPYHTLLERGPMLRSFDQASLQALLELSEIERENKGQTTRFKLDDRIYSRFLRYPFINQVRTETGIGKQTFHELVRRVRLEALRRHYPETKARSHRHLAFYFNRLVNKEELRIPSLLQETTSSNNKEVVSVAAISWKWLTETLPELLAAKLEWFYHALQVVEKQKDVFEEWYNWTGNVLAEGMQNAGEQLLGVVRQLKNEGELLLQGDSPFYGRYLIWQSKFLAQDAQWVKAIAALTEAAELFQRINYLSDAATSFNNIGYNYSSQGELKPALDYYERALTLRKQLGNPIDIANSLNNIAMTHLAQGAAEQALSELHHILMLRKSVGDPAYIAQSLHNIGYAYQTLGRLKESLSYYKQALTIRKQLGNRLNIANTLNNIGSIYVTRGKLSQALRCYQKALELFEQVSNLVSIATTINNIGGIYREQRNYEKSLAHYQQAFDIFNRIGSRTGIAHSLINIGYTYSNQNKPDQALLYYQQALELFKQIDSQYGVAQCFNNIGMIYFGQGNFEQAIEYYQRALFLFRKIGNNSNIALSLNNIGWLYIKHENYNEAIIYFEEALNLLNQAGEDLENKILQGLIDCHIRLERIEKALSYYLLVSLLRNGIDQQESFSQQLLNLIRQKR